LLDKKSISKEKQIQKMQTEKTRYLITEFGQLYLLIRMQYLSVITKKLHFIEYNLYLNTTSKLQYSPEMYPFMRKL
jgi:hypothetical protein